MMSASKSKGYVGHEFEANGLEAIDNDGTKVTLAGTWIVMDWDSTERGAFFLLAPEAINMPANKDQDCSEMFVTCDPYDLIQIIDPEEHARIKRWEDQMEESEQC